jgi:hypothetical protein
MCLCAIEAAASSILFVGDMLLVFRQYSITVKKCRAGEDLAGDAACAEMP